jgi:D-glycero-D-manno-heptose 1,7-bisphosphate phosphatase
MKQKAVFLDRDGTLIEEVNFLNRVEDLRFFSYTEEAVKLLKQNGFLVIILTNQSGVGRDHFPESAVHNIHNAIQNQLTEKIDSFYFCPHLPDAGCICRKPNLGMIELACKDFEIDLDNSWMIGDKILDVQLGFNANIKTAMVKTGYGEKDASKLLRKPDLIGETLIDVVKQIVKNEQLFAVKV